ncbi:hypothetical protein TNCV_2651611 [Trichonephila clavipes]|nr:hypothetical protein TNCV_2651611 [Trichonephila clavipes]
MCYKRLWEGREYSQRRRPLGMSIGITNGRLVAKSASSFGQGPTFKCNNIERNTTWDAGGGKSSIDDLTERIFPMMASRAPSMIE